MGFFFFKQKTAYELGTGDWSSDVCSSDLYNASASSSYVGSPQYDGLDPEEIDVFFVYPYPDQIERASCRERV